MLFLEISNCRKRRRFVLLLFIVFVDISKSIAVGFLSAEQLQRALNNAHLACNVTPTNNQQVSVTCKKIENDELPRLILNFQKANISELRLQWARGEGQSREMLKVLPPFYCEVMRLDSDIKYIHPYAFVNVMGLKKLYFDYLPNSPLPIFGYLPNLKLLSLSGVTIGRLTDHSTYGAWHPRKYKERTFRGVESLETLILNGSYLSKLTVYEVYDLPNLKRIEPEWLGPAGFKNGLGAGHNFKDFVNKVKQKNPQRKRQDEFDPSSHKRKDPSNLRKLLNRESLNCSITLLKDSRIDVSCGSLELRRIYALFDLLQYNNIRVLKLKSTDNIVFYVMPPIQCEIMKIKSSFEYFEDFAFVNVAGLRQLHLIGMPDLRKLPIFGNLPNLELLSLTGVKIPSLTDQSNMTAVAVSSMPTRIFKGAGSLQRLVLHNTPIRQIKPFDLIDLPNLKVILPQRLAPRGFVPCQGAGRELRALIIRYGIPAPVRAVRAEEAQYEDYSIEESEEPPNKRRRMNNRMSFIKDAKIFWRIPTF